jgi:hypothetical protein
MTDTEPDRWVVTGVTRYLSSFGWRQRRFSNLDGCERRLTKTPAASLGGLCERAFDQVNMVRGFDQD